MTVDTADFLKTVPSRAIAAGFKRCVKVGLPAPSARKDLSNHAAYTLHSKMSNSVSEESWDEVFHWLLNKLPKQLMEEYTVSQQNQGLSLLVACLLYTKIENIRCKFMAFIFILSILKIRNLYNM